MLVRPPTLFFTPLKILLNHFSRAEDCGKEVFPLSTTSNCHLLIPI